MADQRNFARIVVAFAALVVAVCAVVVTVKVASTGIVSVKQVRVLDPTAVAQEVANKVQGFESQPATRVSCPVSIVVEANTRFSCEYWLGSHQLTAQVTVVDDQGRLDVNPTG